MSFESINNPCPCESGLEYPYCCGAPDRNAINTIALLEDDGTINGNLPAGVSAGLSTFNRSPDIYPVKLNLFQKQVQLVKMSPYWYSESVFLDAGRILGTCGIDTSARWLLEQSKPIPQTVSPIIFHTAFCGSTLLSKALDAIYDCLPIREPEALSNLLVYMRSGATESDKTQWFDVVLNVLGRRYEANQPAVIKTNDYADGLIGEIASRRPDIPIVFMYTSLTEFFAGCVKAKNRKQWVLDRYKAIAQIAPQYLKNLPSLTIAEDSVSHAAAVYWSYNIRMYLDVIANPSANLRSLNFTDMLNDPLPVIDKTASWFGLSQRQGVNPADELNWIMGVYSKDASYEYSPQKRRDDMKKLLGNYVNELNEADQIARQLLTEDYPEDRLPGSLLV